MNLKEYIANLFKGVDLPENRIIVIHARIKPIMQELEKDNVSYEEISREIINQIEEKFDPVTILIPTYSFSFTKSGVFDIKNSPAETGRFSEEVRKLGYYRTPNPIFSFSDTREYFRKLDVNHLLAFGEESLFNHLNQKDAIILNVGLDDLVATQRHYAEYYFKVEYRFDKYFPGKIIHENGNEEDINFKYYVRDLDRQTNGNLAKITEHMIEEGVLFARDHNKVKVMWITCQPYLEFFRPKMEEDLEYMIK